MKIPRFIIRLIPVLLLWYVITFFLFRGAQGPDLCFNLGNHYALVDFPGWIMRWKSPHEYQKSLEEYKLDPHMGNYPSTWEPVTSKPRISAFCVKGPWVFGKTEYGWFALNTEKKEIYNPCFVIEVAVKTEDGWDVINEVKKDINNPCPSLEEVRKISGINISETDLITKYPTSSFWPSKYEIINPTARGVVKLTTAIFLPLAILAAVGLRRICRLLFSPFVFLKKILCKSIQKQ